MSEHCCCFAQQCRKSQLWQLVISNGTLSFGISGLHHSRIAQRIRWFSQNGFIPLGKKKMGENGSRTACVLHSSAEIGDFSDGLSRSAHSLAGEVDWITAESCSGYAGFLTTDPFLSEKNMAANGSKTMEAWHNRAEICNFGDGSFRVVHFLSEAAERITAEFRSGYAGFLGTDSVLSKRKAGGNWPRTMEDLHSSAEIRNFCDGLSPMAHFLAGEMDRITAEFR
jgi:hypothetical protein